jgi:hypothetical protein
VGSDFDYQWSNMITTYIGVEIETKMQAVLREFYFLTNVTSPEDIFSNMTVEALEWF